jgi:hypothetical protein
MQNVWGGGDRWKNSSAIMQFGELLIHHSFLSDSNAASGFELSDNFQNWKSIRRRAFPLNSTQILRHKFSARFL